MAEDNLPTDIDIDAELAKLYGTDTDPLLPVVMFVPNGMPDTLVPIQYHATTTTIMQAQALLERGSDLNVPDVMARVTKAITAVVKDPDVAHDVAAHLVELDLLK